MEHESHNTGAPNQTQGVLARVSRFLGLRPETRMYRTPRQDLVQAVCSLAVIGGGVLSLAHGGSRLYVLMPAYGIVVLLQVISDFLVGRSPRVVFTLRAFAALASLCVILGWVWAAIAGGYGALIVAATVLAVFGIALAAQAKRTDRRQS